MIVLDLDYKAIGIRIRRYRKEFGLTQQALAEMSNQEPSNISHIERGATKLSLPTIVSISNALGTTVDDLLCDAWRKRGGRLNGRHQIFWRIALIGS